MTEQMNNTGVGKTLKVIGIIEAICGFIAMTIIWEEFNPVLGILVFVVSFVNCMLLVGFGEVIKLLYNMWNKQNITTQILNQIYIDSKFELKTEGSYSAESNNSEYSVLKDIEENLPLM